MANVSAAPSENHSFALPALNRRHDLLLEDRQQDDGAA
jgi:hypothetical protein